MSVTTEGFRAIAGVVREAAEAPCSGAVTALQEACHSIGHTPFSPLTVIEQLASLPASFDVDLLELDLPQGARPGGVPRDQASGARSRPSDP